MSASHLLYYFKGKDSILEQYFERVSVRFLERIDYFSNQDQRDLGFESRQMVSSSMVPLKLVLGCLALDSLAWSAHFGAGSERFLVCDSSSERDTLLSPET